MVYISLNRICSRYGGLGFIIKTVDGGLNWSVALNDQTSYSLFFTTENIGFIAGDGLLKTLNGGGSWTKQASGNYMLSIFFINSDTGYAVGNSGSILKYISPDSCVWSPADGLSDTMISNPLADPIVTTTYFVTAKNNGCVLSDYITVFVNSLYVDAGNDNIIKCGDSIELKAVTNYNGKKPLSMKWSPSKGLSCDTILNPIVKIQENTEYIITVTTPNGCTSSDSVRFFLDIAIESGEDKTIYCGQSVQLNTQSKWLNLFSGISKSLFSVNFIDSEIGYVAGFRGFLKTIDGGINWITMPMGDDKFINSLFFTSTSTGYAAGFSDIGMNGVILKTTDGGSNWSNLTIGTSYQLNSVYFVDNNTGYVVGNPGKIYKTISGGISWIQQNSGVSTILNSVYFPTSSVGYVVGNNGTILKTTNGGSTWIAQKSGTIQNLLSVFFTSADSGMAVGEYNTILKTTDGGSNWSSISIKHSPFVTYVFRSVQFLNSNTGYIAALYNGMSINQDKGAIFKTTDGGNNWVRQLCDSNNYLYSISIPTSECGYACGANGTIMKLAAKPDSFSWSPANGLSNTHVSNPIANPIFTTTYILNASTNGCSVYDSVTVHVNPLKVNAGLDQTVVCGDSAKLLVNNVFVEIDASRYGSTWAIVDSANKIWLSSTPDITTKMHLYLPEGNYSFICKPQVPPSPMKIRIIPFVQDSVSEIIYYSYDTVIIRNFEVKTPVKYKFSWIPSQNLIDPLSSVATYYLTATTPDGCYAKDSMVVIPIPLSIEAGVDKTIVCSGSIQLDSVVSNYTGNNQLSYNWSPNTGLNSNNIPNPVASVNVDTRFISNVTTQNGCFATDSIMVYVVPLTVNAGLDTFIQCGDSAFLHTVTNYKGLENLTYSWTPSIGLNSDSLANPIAQITSNQTYKVVVTSPNSCIATDSVNVSLKPLNAHELCIVGVDNSNKNLVVWNKPITSAIKSFYIYKETSITDIYERIGEINYDSFSVFVDLNSYPVVQSNKYKISINDMCGLESDWSDPHKTMHLAINQGMGSVWNLIWEPYEGFTVSTYKIYRGTSYNNLQQIGSTTSSATQYTDNNPPSGYVYYQVEVVSPYQCNPTRSYNSSLSNIATNNPVGINQTHEAKDLFTIYPNPGTNWVTIKTHNMFSDKSKLKIFDIQGKLVMETILRGQYHLDYDISKLSKGIYYFKLETEKEIDIQKFIKN